VCLTFFLLRSEARYQTNQPLQAITGLVTGPPNLVGFDFVFLRDAFIDGGPAVFGQGEAEGPDRASRAADFGCQVAREDEPLGECAELKITRVPHFGPGSTNTRRGRDDPLNPDPLDLVERDLVAGAVVELGGSRASCAAIAWAFSSVPPPSR
jgi:hypothetical protein